MRTLLFLLATTVLQAQNGGTWTDLGAASKPSNAFPADAGGGTCGVSGACTSNNYAFGTLGAYHWIAWNGGWLDVYRNAFLHWGGGHGDYYGNQISNHSFANNIMSMIFSPSPFNFSGSGTNPCADLGVNAEVMCDGAPGPRHTYADLVAPPRYKAMWSFNGYGLSRSGGTNGATWKLDTSAGAITAARWTRKANKPSGTWNISFCDDDPLRNLAWCLAGSGTINFLVQYNYDTDVWTTRNGGLNFNASAGIISGDKFITMGGPGSRSVLVPNLGYILLNGSDNYVYHDVTSGANATCNGLISAPFPGIAEDPRDGMIVGKTLDSSRTVWILNPWMWTCQQDNPATGPVAANSAMQGVFGNFRYVPSQEGFVYFGDWQTNGFLYKRYSVQKGWPTTQLTCLDLDNDGYGIGTSCTGLDADDNDSAVHTVAQAFPGKFANIGAFIRYKYGNPSRLWYVSPSGNDTTCAVGTPDSPPATPCATFNKVTTQMLPNDMLMARGGSYLNITVHPLSGTPGNPIWIVNYPGEQPFIDNTQGNWKKTSLTFIDIDSVTPHSYVWVEGLKGAGALDNQGCFGGGAGATNIIIRYVDASKCTDGGIDAFNGIKDWLIENNFLHDYENAYCYSGGSTCQHAIYMGSRGLPSANITIRRNIATGVEPGYPAIQWNGRVTNLQVVDNIIYNNPQAFAIAFYQGVSYSVVRANIAWNNNGGFALANYDGDCYPSGTICPYDQTNNLIINNTFYGVFDSAGGYNNPAGIYLANGTTGCPVPVGSCTPAKVGTIANNTFMNNIFAMYEQPIRYLNCTAITFGTTCDVDVNDNIFANTTFKNNDFWMIANPHTTVMCSGPKQADGTYTCYNYAQTTTKWAAASAGNLNVDPLFVSAVPGNWGNAALFDLQLQPTSQMLGAAYVYPIHLDIRGTFVSTTTPTIGVYEYLYTNPTTSRGIWPLPFPTNH